MSRLVALALVLASTSGLELGLSKFNEQATNGSTPFKYFYPKTEEVAETLLQYGEDVDSALEEYTAALKEDNNATLALKRYNEAVESVDGTSCAVCEECKKELSGAQTAIEAIIAMCADNVPADYRAALDKKIQEHLEKVQAIDNSLRLNSNLCYSLRVTPPPACAEANEKALGRLDDVLGKKAEITYYFRSAYFASKENIDECVQDSTKTLQEDLKTRMDAIETCRFTLQ